MKPVSAGSKGLVLRVAPVDCFACSPIIEPFELDFCSCWLHPLPATEIRLVYAGLRKAAAISRAISSTGVLRQSILIIYTSNKNRMNKIWCRFEWSRWPSPQGGLCVQLSSTCNGSTSRLHCILWPVSAHNRYSRASQSFRHTRWYKPPASLHSLAEVDTSSPGSYLQHPKAVKISHEVLKNAVISMWKYDCVLHFEANMEAWLVGGDLTNPIEK